MNRLASKPQDKSFAISTAFYKDASTSQHSLRLQDDIALHTCPETARRLIVLIPTGVDYGPAAHRIWELANATGSSVQFLGLCSNMADEPGLRRELITISALVQDVRIATEVRIEIGTNWIRAIKSDSQPGDMIVCFAEQHAGLLRKQLSQVLQAKLNAPVCILSNLYAYDASQPNWLLQIMAWVGSLGIIAGFFLLQIRITSLPQDWAQTTLLCLSVIGEVWLIWVWNGLFS